MKVKLKDNVIHSGDHGAGKHLKKGETHDLPDAVAQGLIKRDLAVSAEPKAAPKPPAP